MTSLVYRAAVAYNFGVVRSGVAEFDTRVVHSLLDSSVELGNTKAGEGKMELPMDGVV